MKYVRCAVVFLVALTGFVVARGDTEVVGDIEWMYSVENDEAKVHGGHFYSSGGILSGDVSVPAFLGGSPVTALASSAFQYDGVISVALPDTLASIGDSAFNNCSSLRNVEMPASLTNLDDCAFYWCKSLRSIIVPGSVRHIGRYVCFGCDALTSCTLEDGVPYVGEAMFYGAALTEIVLPNSIQDIGPEAFASCSGLTNVCIPASVTNIGERAFEYCYSSDLTHIEFSDGLRSIGDRAFYRCRGLTDIILPSTLEEIGDFAFSMCDSLKTVCLSEGVRSVNGSAFATDTALVRIDVVEENPNYASVDGLLLSKDKTRLVAVPLGLMSADVPDTVTAIGAYAYYDHDAMKSVEISDRIGDIGAYAFYGCSQLSGLELSASVTNIGAFAFCDCDHISALSIPGNVKEIGPSSFARCAGLSAVEIQDGVQKIGSSAFNGCASLVSVSLPKSVTEIGPEAFAGCGGLTTIDIDAENPRYASYGGMIVSKDDHQIVYVSRQLTEAIIPEGVTNIPARLFYECKNLTTVVIPSTVRTIGDSAFYGCENLTDLELGEGVETIGDSAFRGCGITDLVLPACIRSIGNYAFIYCDIVSAEFPDGIRSIGDCAFMRTGLVSVSLPNSLERLGSMAFAFCDSLQSIQLPSGVSFQYNNFAYEFNEDAELAFVEIDSGNPHYSSVDGVVYNKEVTELLYVPPAKKSITIPATVEMIWTGYLRGLESFAVDVANTRYSAFDGMLFNKEQTALVYCPENRADIVLPASCYWIEGAAFSGSSIRSVVFPPYFYGNIANAFSYSGYYNGAEYVLSEHCSNLQSLYFEEYAPSDLSDVLDNTVGIFSNCTIYARRGWEHLGWDCEIPGEYNGVRVEYMPEFTYYESEGGIVITGINGDVPEELWIPAVYDGYTVVGIGDQAFYGRTELKKVTLSKGLRTIRDMAFYACENLERVILPDGLQSINWCAFYGPNKVRQFNVPASVTDVGCWAFGGDKLEAVIYNGENAPTFADSEFGCSGGAVICVKQGSEGWGCQIPGGANGHEIDYMADFTYSLDENGRRMIAGIEGMEELSDIFFERIYHGYVPKCLVIPETYNGEEVVGIRWEAFVSCSQIEKVHLPVTLEEIGNFAFAGCYNLRSVTIPRGARLYAYGEDIARRVFAWCSSLSEITVEEGNPWYSSRDGILYDSTGTCLYAIPGGRKSYVYIGAEVTNVCARALSWCCCSLQDFYVSPQNPNYKSVDGLLCSKDGKMLLVVPGGRTTLTTPSQIVAIESDSILGLPTLERLVISETVTQINQDLGVWCTNLQDVVIQSGNKGRTGNAFAGCLALTNITIMASEIGIVNTSFWCCRSLKELVVPASVTALEIYFGCTNLCNITFEGDCPQYFSPGGRLPESCVLHVRRGSMGWGVPVPGNWGGVRIEYYGAEIDKGMVTLSTNEVVYAASEQKVAVTVKDGETVLTEGVDYGIEWIDNIDAGDAKVVVNGMGDYSGSVTNTFKILPRTVVLTSGTACKKYDGTPLTNPDIAISGLGWAEGEGATYDVTGSQTVVGSSANTFGYSLNDNTKKSNYAISKVEGTLEVTSGDIGGGGGEEPGGGEIPEGGLSKFDATYVYDGEGHTINTQALFAVTLKGATPSFSFAKDGGGVGHTALPSDVTWVAEPPTYTNVGEYVVWYRITASNYSNFVHAAKVTIKERPRVVSLTIRTRYPWKNLVDFDCEVVGDPSVKCALTLNVSTSKEKEPLPVRTLTCETARGRIVENHVVVWPGKHRLTWDAGADLSEDVLKVRCDASVSADVFELHFPDSIKDEWIGTSVESSGHDRVRLSWLPVLGAEGYRIDGVHGGAESQSDSCVVNEFFWTVGGKQWGKYDVLMEFYGPDGESTGYQQAYQAIVDEGVN